MKTLIFLDDERNFKDVTWVKYPEFEKVIIVRTYKEFQDIVEKYKSFDNLYFSFDHDIQDFNSDDSENTGYSCVIWLCDYMIDNNIQSNSINHIVHSKNPIGKENINRYLENFKIHC